MQVMFKVFLYFGCMASVLNAVPLDKHVVDMTHTFDETTLNFPSLKEFHMNISVLNESFAPWVQIEEYSSGIHVGTHMDAPKDVIREGKTIEQLDVRHFIAPASVVDITAKSQLDSDYGATVEDLLEWESRTGQTLNETILLLRTGWGQKWNNRTAYFGMTQNGQLHFPGLSAEAAQWLADYRNIFGVGTDALSYDIGATVDYPAHKILLGKGMFGLENVARMEDIPIYGATLYVLPMKIGKATGAPVRILATFPKVVFDIECDL